MTCQYESLYEVLRTQLEDCKAKYEVGITCIECCFMASASATVELMKKAVASGFKSSCEEIKFFKEIKPKFYCEVEYHRLLYHFELFEPDEPKAWREFWKREVQRLDKFIQENKEFYGYIKAGHEHNDSEYFLQCSNNKETIADIFYQSREYASSSHDHLVAMIIALERFNRYLTTKLDSIEAQE